jgi:hypothetical protein
VTTPPTPPPFVSLAPRPASDADWAAWQDQRSLQMAPLWDRREELTSHLENATTQEAATRAEVDRMILDTDIRTTLPPHISDDGQFQPGDFRGYLNERSNGGFEQMTAEDQRRYILTNQFGADYEQQAAQEAARRDGQTLEPGVAGVALGEILAQTTTTTATGRRTNRAPTAPRSRCLTCTPSRPTTTRDPEVWMYRGILLRRGQAVDGARPGQMASTDPRDALSYGINPTNPHNVPAGATELVLMRFRVRQSQMTDYGGAAPPGPEGGSHHIYLPPGTDVTRLPGYAAVRIPVSTVAGPPSPGNGRRDLNDAAVRLWSERLGVPGGD